MGLISTAHALAILLYVECLSLVDKNGQQPDRQHIIRAANMQAVTLADLQGQLHHIAAQSDQKQKLELYKQLLHTVLAVPSQETCNAFVDHSA